MGIHEAILHHVGEKNREEGIKIGEAKGRQEMLQLTTKIIRLILKGWTRERIAKHLKITTELVQKIYNQFHSDEEAIDDNDTIEKL